MSNQYEQIKRDLIDAMDSSKPRTGSYDTTAEVLYVDGGTAWVKIPGGAPETPVERSIAVKRGDIVQVRVANGRAWINGNNTAPPTDDTTAIYAHTVATEAHTVAVETQEEVEELEEHFWYDGEGAHVLGNKSGYRNDIRSDGMHIVEAVTDEEVASFGADGTQLGKSDESHAIFDYHSMQLVSRLGTPIFEVKDARDRSGFAEITQTYTGDGSTSVFSVDYPAASVVSVTVAGTALPSSDYTITSMGSAVMLHTAPADGASVVIVYKTGANVIYFTFGNRKSGSQAGSLSHAVGEGVEASGSASHAEGHASVASGKYTHAEGYNSVASGRNAHAEGQYTEASGGSSHAQNTYTIAAGSAQTAIGRYNVADSASIYALIIGNGSSSARSNAIGVKWDGDYEFLIDSSAASGTADGDLYAALTAKGWASGTAGTGSLTSLKKVLAKTIEAAGSGGGGGSSYVPSVTYATSDSQNTYTLTATVASAQSFSLTAGAVVAVKFTYAKPYQATQVSFTLNVNNTGAKVIYCNGGSLLAVAKEKSWGAGDIVLFVYDGTYWQWVGKDRAASTSDYGIVQLSSATNSTSTTQAATPSAVKTAYDLANSKSAVTLNGAATATPSFFAPTTGGTIGYILKSNGASAAPVWAEDTGDQFPVLLTFEDGDAILDKTFSQIVTAILANKYVYLEDYDYRKYPLLYVDTENNILYFSHMEFTGEDNNLVGCLTISLNNDNETEQTYTETAEVPAPANTTPVRDGTASIGASNRYARADHIHPKITQTLSMSGNVITLTGSDGTSSSVTLPVYNGGVT